MQRQIFNHEEISKTLIGDIPKVPESQKLSTEHLLFHMPDEAEAFLAALVAVEAYDSLRESEKTTAILNGGTYADWEIFVECREEYAFMLNDKCHRGIPSLVGGMSAFDLEVYLDTRRALSLVSATERTLPEGFAMLIGSNIETIFPQKARADDLRDAHPIVYVMEDARWYGWKDLVELLRLNYSELYFRFVPALSVIRATTLEYIKNSCAMIGVRGFETYLAAANKRMTIEITPGPYRNYLAKFECPFYSMIYAGDNIEAITPTLVFRAFDTRAKQCKLLGRIKK
jgi:hypothetical protein